MKVYGNYKEYKKYLPEYKEWRDKQELDGARRREYLKQNPDKINQDDIQRGKILLHAVDVMDEYSQVNAEDMEVATEMAQGQAIGFATSIGSLAGIGLMQIPKIKSWAGKLFKNKLPSSVLINFIGMGVGYIVGFAASFPVITWATKAQISASRKGRFEAMRKDLKNPAIFAVLTDEQMKKVQEDAKSIELEDRDKKRLNQGGIGLFDSFKTLKKLYKEQGDYKKQKEEFDKALEENEKFFNKTLSEKQIRDAKRDRQMLADVVRKMDIASQDYAENTELVTNTVTALAFAGGGLLGWISNKIMKAAKVNHADKATGSVPYVVGLVVPLAVSIYSAKLQKQASRVGRFNVRQEMLRNPESLVYVDEKDSDKMTNVRQPEKAKKPNMFKFFKQLLKDNRAYKKYKKTQGVEELKLHKATEKLQLSDEQIRKAKVLQMNIFKTFNKVDEKSQTYAESVEAVGQMLQQGVSVFGTLIALGLSGYQAIKILESSESAAKSSMAKTMAKLISPMGVVLASIIGIEIWTTKAQKKASRVADMLALKELSDHRHYADYFDSVETVDELQAVPQESNLLKRFTAK